MIAQNSNQEKANYVHNLFSRIAENYDRMNWIMTAGNYRRWNREAIHLLELKPGETILDIGCGTGDLAIEAKRQNQNIRLLAGDFTLQMMLVGKETRNLPFFSGDALDLPFSEDAFDGVVSGYLVRNVSDLDRALAEQKRILKIGGKIIILDTTRPKKNLLTPFIWLHMHLVIPMLGKWISGVGEAYRYLPDSSENFLEAEELAERLKKVGFVDVHFKRLMFGTIALHWAIKP